MFYRESVRPKVSWFYVHAIEEDRFADDFHSEDTGAMGSFFDVSLHAFIC